MKRIILIGLLAIATSGLYAVCQSNDIDKGKIANTDLKTNLSSDLAINNTQTDSPPVQMIDPGGDPDESERIPVGEGALVLSILAAVYGTYIKFGRK